MAWLICHTHIRKAERSKTHLVSSMETQAFGSRNLSSCLNQTRDICVSFNITGNGSYKARVLIL